MTDEKECSRHGHDISKSLCPLCAVEAKEGAVANAEADRDHWKKEAEGWRVQFTNAANVADKLKEQLDETKLFSGDIEGALRRAVEEANRTGQAMGAARAAARISAVETERDQAILNAGKCPPRREAVVGKPSTWEEVEAGEGGAEFEAFVTWWVDYKSGVAFRPEEQDAAWIERADRGTPGSTEPTKKTRPDPERVQAALDKLRQNEDRQRLNELVASGLIPDPMDTSPPTSLYEFACRGGSLGKPEGSTEP